MPSTIRTRALLTAPAVALLGLAACRETPSAPPVGGTPARAKSGSVASSDTTYSWFKYQPNGTTAVNIAAVHKLVMDGGSVCDPSTTSYGVGEWDRPCAPLTTSMTIGVKSWRDANGRPQVVFYPDVRFAPGKSVMLYLADKEASASASARIVWCPTGGAECVDESATDPTVATQFDRSNGTVYRRLKHFSGYHIIFRSGEGDGGDGSMDGGY